MTHIRRPLVGLLGLFVVAITLDRLGVAAGTRAIDSYVYVIALLAAVGPLVLPSLRRSRPWAGLVVAGLAYLGIGTLLVDGAAADIHVVVTEVVFVALAVVLGQQIAAGVVRLDDALGAAAFGESPALDIEGPVAANEIHTELARSRRHDRPLTVTVLQPLPSSLEAAVAEAEIEIQRSLRKRFILGRLARTVGRVLRRSDLLFEHQGDRFVILSPETDADGTELLIRRLKEASGAEGLAIATGSAAFPDQAIAFEQLVARAEDDLAAELAPPALRAVENGRTA